MLLCIQHVIVCTILTERLFPRPPRLCIKTRASLRWAWPLYSLSRSWRVEIRTLRSCITVPGISVLHYQQNHTRMFDGCNNTADGCCVCTLMTPAEETNPMQTACMELLVFIIKSSNDQCRNSIQSFQAGKVTSTVWCQVFLSLYMQ